MKQFGTHNNGIPNATLAEVANIEIQNKEDHHAVDGVNILRQGCEIFCCSR